MTSPAAGRFIAPAIRMRRRRGAAIVGFIALVALAGAVAARRPHGGIVVATLITGRGQGPRFVAVDPSAEHAVVVDTDTAATLGYGGTGGPGSASAPGRVDILDLRTGALVHTSTVGFDPDAVVVDSRHHRALIVGAGHLLNGGSAGGVSTGGNIGVVDTRTGRVVDVISTSGLTSRGSGAAAVDATTGLAFVPSYNGSVSVLDTASGRLVRTVAVAGNPFDVAVDKGAHRAFVVGTARTTGTAQGPDDVDGVVGALDTTSGRLVRTTTVGPNPASLLVDPSGGRVYVANSGDGTVSVLDARSGRLLRTIALTAGGTPLAGGVQLAVDARTRRLFVNSGRVSVVDTVRGTVLRAYRFAPVDGPTALDSHTGRVFAANYGDGRVRVLDAASGRLLRTVDVGAAPADLAVDEHSGQVYIATAGPAPAPMTSGIPGPTTPSRDAGGTIYVLDARDGAILHQVAVGPNPVAVAASTIGQGRATEGRILALSIGGAVPAPDPWEWLPGGVRRLLPFIPRPGLTLAPGSVAVLDASR